MIKMAKQDKKVLCVGLCCLDIVMDCKSYPEEDSDQRCLSHAWQRGGNASNNCTIFSEFNVPCEILGTMSKDVGGQDMPEVSLEDFKLLDLNNYNWVHFEVRPEYEQMILILEHIRLWNSKKSHEPILVSMEVEKPRIECLELLHLIDFLFISKDFAQSCGYDNMRSAVEELYHKIRPGASIICAWGDQGAAAKSADRPIVFSPAYPPAKVVNTLAAGDTFVAATIIALIKGRDLPDAINIGCKVAGAKCGMHDAVGLSELFPNL